MSCQSSLDSATWPLVIGGPCGSLTETSPLTLPLLLLPPPSPCTIATLASACTVPCAWSTPAVPQYLSQGTLTYPARPSLRLPHPPKVRNFPRDPSHGFLGFWTSTNHAEGQLSISLFEIACELLGGREDSVTCSSSIQLNAWYVRGIS